MSEKKDIVPELLENIEKEFEKALSSDKRVSAFFNLVEEGQGDYSKLNEAAKDIGENLSSVLQNNLTEEILPDGKFYFNIADRVLNTMMKKDYELIADLSQKVQSTLNKNVGIGIAAIKPELNADRIKGLVEKTVLYDSVAKSKWLLGEPIINFSQSIVDDSVKANATFHAQAGIKATIERIPHGKPCNYCAPLAGKYTYPNVPENVYRRHRACRCVVTYNPGNGKRQNVHTKKWENVQSKEKIEMRKRLGLTDKTAKERVQENLEKLPKEKDVKIKVQENIKKLENSKENAIIKEKANTKYNLIKQKQNELGIKGELTLNPKPIDVDGYKFDIIHIQQERNRLITREEAIEFMNEARLSLSKWNNRFHNYYSDKGAVYIDSANQNIRTAFTSGEYEKRIKELIMEIKKYE